MEHVELMKIYKRVCKQYRGSCSRCILSSENNGTRCACCVFMCDHPEKAEEILIKWDKEHPQKTRLSDFKEKYPNAPMNNDNIPLVCSRDVGYLLECPSNKGYSKFTCTECWNQPIDE